jgi:hypothetical protein
VEAEGANPGLGLREIRAVGGVADLIVVKFVNKKGRLKARQLWPSWLCTMGFGFWLWTHAPCRHTARLSTSDSTAAQETPPF